MVALCDHWTLKPVLCLGGNGTKLFFNAYVHAKGKVVVDIPTDSQHTIRTIAQYTAGEDTCKETRLAVYHDNRVYFYNIFTKSATLVLNHTD